MKVVILTRCCDMNLLYGATLTFKTLRVGFPSADVTVVDNASIMKARSTLRRLARQVGCGYHQLHQQIPHQLFLDWAITNHNGVLVLLDPDLCFWEDVEDWHFDGLMAGRLIPRNFDPMTGCLVLPRLHTSFLWIPDARRLRERAREITGQYCAFAGLLPLMFPIDGEWHFLDVGAGLYAALQDEVCSFGERHLNAYDHLFGGTHPAWVSGKLPEPYRSDFLQWHTDAQGDYRKLQGIWRQQQEYFARYSVDADHIVAPDLQIAGV